MNASTALSVRGLTGGYGELTVIRDVDIEIRPGQITVLLGRNGAGKTTLLSGIAGLLPAMSQGSVVLRDHDVSPLPAYRRIRAGLGFVQEGKRIFKGRTVEENLLLGTISARSWSLRSTHRKSVLEASYSRFPVLHEKRHDRAGGLSGGQQQMLAIAQALAAEPNVLMLDEPSAGLAPAIRDEVFEVVKALREEGLGILLVEQLVDVVLEFVDWVTVLDSGAIVSTGPPSEYRDGEQLKQIYLGASG